MVQKKKKSEDLSEKESGLDLFKKLEHVHLVDSDKCQPLGEARYI